MQKKNRCPKRKTGRRSPIATLINWSPDPFNTVYQTYFYNKHARPLSSCRSATKREFDFVFQLLKEDWCGLLEMSVFVWHFVLPRSLHAQMRSHRHWSFFSESHQLMDVSEFAEQGDYFHIPDGRAMHDQREWKAMFDAQHHYRKLLDQGVLPALARGVLPMHINLGLTASCSLRSMFKVIVQRNCDILQGTYWKPLLKGMETELCEKVDRRFSKFFKLKPCDINNRCQSTIEQKLRIAKKDPHEPCPIYLEKFYVRDRL